MNSTPFFTIGVPVYNAEKFLSGTIDSILNQSFTDFEIIFVNDGSSDKSLDILNDYRQKDKRIKIISKNNGGVSSARNTILYNITGKYVYFIDSDDFMCEDALQNAYNTIISNNFPDVLHAGFIRVVLENETPCPNKYNPYMFSSDDLTNDEKWVEFVHINNNDVGHLCAKYFKTEFLNNEGLTFIERLGAQEDYDFICNTFRRAKSMSSGDFYAFKYIKQRENSISTVWRYKAVLGVFSHWMNYFSDTKTMDLSDKHKMMAYETKKNFVSQVRNGTIKMPFHKSKDEAFKFIELMEEFGLDREIRKLPVFTDNYWPVWLCYKILGIRNTQNLLFIYKKVFK